MVSESEKYTLRYKLPVMLQFFKKHEGKDYDDKVGIEQVNTQYGLYLFGQITLIEEILNKEI